MEIEYKVVLFLIFSTLGAILAGAGLALHRRTMFLVGVVIFAIFDAVLLWTY